MAIGIEIALDPSQAVRGADQVDKALDGIADSATNAQKILLQLDNTNFDKMTKSLDSIQSSSVETSGSLSVLKTQGDTLIKAFNDLAAALKKTGDEGGSTTNKNEALIRSLSKQIQLAKMTGAEAEKLKNSWKLGADATDTQRYAVEKLTEQLYRLNNAEKQTSSAPAGGAMEGLLNAGKAFIGLQVVQQLSGWGRAFISVADDMKLLQARLEVYTSSQAEAGRVLEQLVESSNRTGVAVKDAAQSFTQFKPAAEALGLTSDQTIKLVTNLQNMARVSGASSQAASAAIYQLSQSFSKGKLNGDELVSVSENLPIVLEQLANKLGVTSGELTQMAQAQQLTSDKLALLSGDFEDVNAKIEKLPRTTEQAGQALTNNIGLAIAAIDQQIGASKYFAKFLDLLSGGAKGVADLVTSAAQFDKIAAAGEKLNNVTAQREKTTKEIADLEAQIRQGYSTKSFGGYTQFVNGTAEAQRKLTALRELDVKLAKDQADAQKNLTSVTPLTDKAVGNLTSQISQIQADLNKAKNTGRADPESAKAIKNLQDQLTYTKALAAGNYELAASSKLGSNATKEQVAAYAALLKQQTDFRTGQKETKKATSEAESAAKREQKQLEQNQEANRKYIKTLQDKTTAGQFDVQRAKEQVAQSMLQGQSVDELTSSYLKSVQVQNQLTLQSKQAEAQSRLNADATDTQRQAVDDYVASLYKQEQAQKLAGQVSQISQSNQQILNPVASGFSSTVSQAAQSMATLNEAQKAGVLVGKEYKDAVLQNNQAGMVSLINQLQAGQTAFTDFSAKMGSAAIGLAQFKVSAGDASFLDGFTASLSGLMQGYEGFANGATDLFSGFFASFTDGFANSIGQAVVGAQDLDEALKNVAQQAIAGLISGFIKLGIQYATNAALAATFGTAITATTAGLAATTAAAWAPAAALASLASFGANAAPAAAALTTTTGLAAGLALVPGFANGGYISGAGTGTSDSIPARLSNGEYVMPARQTRQYRNELAAMRAGSYTGGSGSQMNVEVANYGNDKVQVQQMDESRVRLIIGEEVPRINASEFNNPYSQTNKAYRSNYNAERKV